MTEREPQQGDKIVVTMNDSGHRSPEIVGLGGVYPSKSHVDRSEATVHITHRFEDTVWGKTHRYTPEGLLVLKENSDV